MSGAIVTNVVLGGLSYLGGRSSARSARRAGEASREAAYANAADIREIAAANSAAYLYAGDVNAGAVLNIGEANATAIERATARNAHMAAISSAEDRRRHVLNQKLVAGDIRARVGSSGVQTNTGSPLHYLHGQVKLGIQERRWGDIKSYWTIRNIMEEGEDRAAVTRLTAEENAKVIQANSAVQAEMSALEAERQATAQERSGDVAAVGASAQASSILWQGIGQAAQFAMPLFASAMSPNTGFYSSTIKGFDSSRNYYGSYSEPGRSNLGFDFGFNTQHYGSGYGYGGGQF